MDRDPEPSNVSNVGNPALEVDLKSLELVLGSLWMQVRFRMLENLGFGFSV